MRLLPTLLLTLTACFISDPAIEGVADADGDGLCIEGWATPSCPLDCAPGDASSGAQTVFLRDADGDGFAADDTTDTQLSCIAPGEGWTTATGDCDDEEDSVYPDAPELCDGQINRCSTTALPANESDEDSDNYVACAIDEDGWDGLSTVLGGDDCNDEAPLVHPNADEQCNDDDDDCDSRTDEDVTFQDWYADTDNDGQGDPDSTAVNDCVNPGASAPNNTDCDDNDDTIYTGATELCDGQINHCSTSTLPANETDGDGDFRVPCPIDSNGWDGDGGILGGDDCDDTEPTVYTGADELCDGIINNCSTSSLPPNESDDDGDGYVECPPVQDWAGAQIWGGDDCDDDTNACGADCFPAADEICGDGVDNDCSPNNCNSGADALASGAIDTVRDGWYIADQRLASAAFFGRTSPQNLAIGTATQDDIYVFRPGAFNGSGEVTSEVQTIAGGDIFGAIVSGSRWSDNLLVWETAGTGKGWVIDSDELQGLGFNTTVTAVQGLSSTVVIQGGTADSGTGMLMWSDFDGNGTLDLINGDVGNQNIHVLYDAASYSGGTISLDDVGDTTGSPTFPGLAIATGSSQTSGYPNATGDLVGDSAQDIVLYSRQSEVISIIAGGSAPVGSTSLSAVVEVTVDLTADGSLLALPAVGNFDGDQDDDLAVGTQGDDTVSIFLGNLNSAGSPYDGGDADITLTGTTGEKFGSALTAGDLNCDGYDDLVVGAVSAGGDAGRVAIWFGAASPTWTNTPDLSFTGLAAGNRIGIGLAFGDADGDACPDLLITADDGVSGGSNQGEAYLIRGRNTSD